jgi:hypothetical protein
MNISNIRYIVFMLNPDVQQYTTSGAKIETHDGEIFCSLKEAQEYANDAIDDKLCTRFAIGMFVYEPQAQQMSISMVETFGFKNDRKNVNQLEIFDNVNPKS